MKSARDRLIIALDVPTGGEAIALARKLRSFAATMKVGLQLFIAEGPELVRALRGEGVDVFLDLKLNDIPNTVARAVESAAKLDVQMLTLHLSGGGEMMRAAIGAAPASLLLLGVTVLTSADSATLREVGINHEPAQQVERLATLGLQSGLRGFVASAQELPTLRRLAGHAARLVIPGIRPGQANTDDQKRTATPAEAIAAGADYLVIGRPIIAAPDPAEAAQSILVTFAA